MQVPIKVIVDSETKKHEITVGTPPASALIKKEAGIQNLSADFMGRLDEKVRQVVLDACNRAKENGRRTVMGKDV